MQCANRMPQLVAEIGALKAHIAQVEGSNGGDRELALVLRQELVQLVKQQTLLMEARIARQTGGAAAGKAPAAPAGKACAAGAKGAKAHAAAPAAAPAAPAVAKAVPSAVDINDTAALDEFELVEVEGTGKTNTQGEAKGQGKQQQGKANPAAPAVAEQQVKGAQKQQVGEDKAARVAAKQAQCAAVRQQKQAQRALRQGAERAAGQAQPGAVGDDDAQRVAQRQAKRAARLQAASLLVAPAIQAAQANRAEWEAVPTEGEQRFRAARKLAVPQLQNAHRLLREAFMQGLDSKPTSGPDASAVPATNTNTAAAAGVGPIAA